VVPLRPAGLFTFTWVCALLLVACSPTAPTETEAPGLVTIAPSSPVDQAIVDLTNQERMRQGLGTLRVEARLSEAARLQAEQLVRAGRLDHVLPDAQYPRPEDRLAAAGYPWQAYGENLAFGYPDARSAVDGWINSPGHRANIVGTTFTEIGAGHATDASGRTYYAQVFGRPR
jgi:uncharacterized protein YkwD